MHNSVYRSCQYSGDIWRVFFFNFFLLDERCGLVLCEGLTLRQLRGVVVAHVALVDGAAIRVPGEVFPDLFPGKSLEGLVQVEGVASLVLAPMATISLESQNVAIRRSHLLTSQTHPNLCNPCCQPPSRFPSFFPETMAWLSRKKVSSEFSGQKIKIS